jgi:cell division protein FtsL
VSLCSFVWILARLTFPMQSTGATDAKSDDQTKEIASLKKQIAELKKQERDFGKASSLLS